MPDNQLEELPSEIRDQLQEGAQQIFLAAFKSAQRDGMNEQAATNVAWNSVKQWYQQGDDGKWHRKPDAPNTTRKAVQTGGN